MENSDGVLSTWGMNVIIENAACLLVAGTTQYVSRYVVGQTKSTFS